MITAFWPIAALVTLWGWLALWVVLAALPLLAHPYTKGSDNDHAEYH